MKTIVELKWIAVVMALAIGAAAATAGTPAKGDKFPDLSTFGLEGALPSFAGKVVLVDFFASWCGPCQESFPAMEKLHQKYALRGLVIVAINLDKKPEDMQKFLKDHPVTFATVRDASFKLVNEVKIPTMPSSFLLDRSGKVFAMHRGFEGSKTEKQYVEEIESLLK
ncbi:MAG TPA: TlpA disulfide reductase family protein [Verrucomicrobiae bacterium]|nr:TlpA disulfide reductase family protein [Verrucomicrobiae bacterium]